MKIIICLAALIFLGFAQDITFIGTDGVWNKASNWNPTNVPNRTNNVIINSNTLDLPSNATFLSLIASSSSIINVNYILSLSSAVNITISSSTINIHASINGTGTIFVQGSYVLLDNNATVYPNVIASQSVTLNITSGSFWSVVTSDTIDIYGGSYGVVSVQNFWLSGTLGSNNLNSNLTVNNLWWSASTVNYNLWVTGNTYINGDSDETLEGVSVTLAGPVWWTGARLYLDSGSQLTILGNVICGNASGPCNIESYDSSTIVNIYGTVNSTGVIAGTYPQTFYQSDGTLNSYGSWVGGITLYYYTSVLNLYDGTVLSLYPVTSYTTNIIGKNIIIPLFTPGSGSQTNITGSGTWIAYLQGTGTVTSSTNVTISNVADAGTLKFYGVNGVYYIITTSASFQSDFYLYNTTLWLSEESQGTTYDNTIYLFASAVINYGNFSIIDNYFYFTDTCLFINFNTLYLYGDNLNFGATETNNNDLFINAGTIYSENSDVSLDVHSITFFQCPSGKFYFVTSSNGYYISEIYTSAASQINGQFIISFPNLAAWNEFNSSLYSDGLSYLQYPPNVNDIGAPSTVAGTFVVIVEIAGSIVPGGYLNCNNLASQNYGYGTLYPNNASATYENAQCIGLLFPTQNYNSYCPAVIPPVPVPQQIVVPSPSTADQPTSNQPISITPHSTTVVPVPTFTQQPVPQYSPPNSGIKLLVSVFAVVLAVITVI